MLIACNFQYLIVFGTVRLWLDGIRKPSTTEEWSEILSEVDGERTLHPIAKIIRLKE